MYRHITKIYTDYINKLSDVESFLVIFTGRYNTTTKIVPVPGKFHLSPSHFCSKFNASYTLDKTFYSDYFSPASLHMLATSTPCFIQLPWGLSPF